MKHKRSIALLLVVATLIALPSRLSAQTYEFRDGNGVYLVEYVPIDELDDDTKLVIKTNYAGFKEVRLGLGYNPATPHGYSSTLEWKDYPLTLPANTELNRTRWFTTNFDTGYWLKRWLYIGGVATWTTGSERVSNCINHKRVDAYNYDNITIMPIIRFAWVNRGAVQLYSGIGLGATYEFYDRSLTTKSHYLHASYDVTFIGITVGRQWFGYFDIGAGYRGVISAGIGYRFNNK